MEEGTTDVVEIERELELEVEPEDVTKFLQFHDKTLWMTSCFLCIHKESGFFEVESTPHRDAVKTVEVTTKDLEYYIK